ncbi:MAG TPA: hypothetical protein VFF06_11920 [Polyangia bacterium]|nr:hypothetical protein [Polyangia bacterium]
MKKFEPPAPEAVARVRAFTNRRLTPEEFNAYVNAPMSADELEAIHSLINWFTRRYPTVAERLAWGERAYAQAKRWMPPDK